MAGNTAQAAPSDVLQVASQIGGICADDNVNQDRKEVVRASGAAVCHVEQVVDDSAAVEDANKLVARGLHWHAGMHWHALATELSHWVGGQAM